VDGFEKNNQYSYFEPKVHKMSFPRKEYPKAEGKKPWTLAEAKTKLAAYCAYQERCQEEVRAKLAERRVFDEDAENLIVAMIEEGFLNEERFAKAYARGKFNLKKWGRNKIQQELKRRKISAYCIKQAMKEIDGEEYWQTILHLTERKLTTTKCNGTLELKYKTSAYLISRGFETDLIEDALRQLLPK
jgi:regulatory protein